jgi:Fe2+ transport system protein FeoA
MMDFQPHRLLMMGLDPGTYIAVIWGTSQFGGHALSWRLNAKT